MTSCISLLITEPKPYINLQAGIEAVRAATKLYGLGTLGRGIKALGEANAEPIIAPTEATKLDTLSRVLNQSPAPQ